MRANGTHAIHVSGKRHQIMVNGNGNFATDRQWRLHQKIQCPADRALGRIFNRHNTEISRSGFCRPKNLINRSTRNRVNRLAEMLVNRLFGKSAFRPEISHDHFLFQRTARRHDFAENGLQFVIAQRARIPIGNSSQNLSFPFRAENRGIDLVFNVTDFLCHTCPTIQQIQ